MTMSFATALATYFLIWWVTLFAVLPWGVRSQHEEGSMPPGTDPGAPTDFRLGWKLLWTTVAASVIFAAFYTVYSRHLVTLDELMSPFLRPK